MKRDLPTIIHEVGFDFNWINNKVWELDLPVEVIPIDELAWLLDYPFIWPIPAGYTQVTPRQVIENPEEFPVEYSRTQQADTKFPIDIMFWKNKWLILDGLHRLMKQSMTGKQTIRVRKVPHSAIPNIQDNRPGSEHRLPQL